MVSVSISELGKNFLKDENNLLSNIITITTTSQTKLIEKRFWQQSLC
jgi:hypothetical protein